MIEILESPKYLVAMKVSGNLTADDVAAAYKAVEDALKEHERISFFAEVEDTIGITLDGLVKDFIQVISHFGKMSKYYRASVVTDKGWIATMARVEGLVFSSIDVRVFEPAERAKAFAWASEKPEPLPKPEDAPASVHFLQTTNENVFAYEVNGKLREKDVKAAVAAMKPYLEREGKFNVLAHLEDFGGFDLLAALDDDLVKTKYKSIAKVDKYAIIGAKAWMRNFLELVSGLFSAEIRFFDPEEEHAAWEWVGAEQALLAGK
ncbi:MAG: STAS/SEC14 domain-containing protein [Pyrinomonadaceae bacterium]|nr:STAS/SEC14 domain-containing protein [Pyrinomonadaceae bacterium]